MFEDNIFRGLIEEENCIARHRENIVGVKHLNRVMPRIPQPVEPVTLTLTTSGPVPFDAARCWYTSETGPSNAEGDDNRTGTVIDLSIEGTVWDDVSWSYVRRWTGTLFPQTAGALVRYRLGARIAGTDRWVYADNQADALEQASEFALWFDSGCAPPWACEAVIYHIFLDRFYPGDGRDWIQAADLADFFGGTLRGVIQKLDYIQSLGFNALWLSPLFPSPTYHGYGATDYYQVEPRLGTNADLKELMETAHKRGIRVILDFVANHWSDQHPTFEAAKQDEHSSYHDWYTWNRWPDDYVSFFDVRELPRLNLKQRAARDYLLASARYWLEQGASGLRLDHAYGPPHEFWTDFRRTCRTVRPDCWLLGEIVHTAAVQASYAWQLDGTLDFLLASALRETFAHRNWGLDQFEAFLAAHESFFPPGFSRPAFLDNHDIDRFLFIAGQDVARLRLAALALYTLSAPPIVYYGTEVGVTQERPIQRGGVRFFEEARQPMKWGAKQATDLLDYFRQLAELRRCHPVLTGGSRRVLHLDAVVGTYAYLRAAESDGYDPGDVLVALNVSAEPCTVVIPLTARVPAVDLLGGQPVRVEADRIEIELGPQSGAFVACSVE